MSPIEELRHSSAHVLAAAILRLYPSAKLDIGPPTANGFYYDIDYSSPLGPEDLAALEAEMQAIIQENQRFECCVVTREEAQAFFEAKHQSYKLERLADIPAGEPITFYKNGEFTDLCAGTHLGHTSQIKAFKLLSIAGAYYRGNEKNKQLQRIYGTAFFSKKELDEHLKQMEEAKLRDHRKLGKDLELFHIDEAVGQGLILWLPKGAMIRKTLQEFISEELQKQGYDFVFTPHIGRLELYKTSGHFPYYQDSQFPPLVDKGFLHHLAQEGCSCADLSSKIQEGDLDGYLLKPMNCPMHIKIYDSKPRSYRDLPLRFAEFGTVYRWEQSGELNGMTRVRCMTQDDAHIFCTQDQVFKELKQCIDLVKIVLQTLGMQDYKVRLSLRDPLSDKYVGTADLWERAENTLREVVQLANIPYFEGLGEAAFYGPKIDFMVKDVIGREWQLGTIQLDYQLPERFKLAYTGSDNQDHRPVMIHRAPFGTMERFVGLLIEHFGGNFPTWLAPEQVRILSLKDEMIPYAKEIETHFLKHNIRVSLDTQSDKLGAKIRKAELAKVPYMVIVGEKERDMQTLSIRSRFNKAAEGTHSLETFTKSILEEVALRLSQLKV